MPRALVTGAAGFIGSNVARRLLESGYDVVALDDLSTGYRRNLAPLADVEFVEGDVRDESMVSGVMRDIDVVCHLAASVGNMRSIEQPIQDSEINVIGTLRVLEAARRSNVERVVYSSSAAIFGELKQLPIREDHPAEPASPYGASKLAAEKLCLVYSFLYELDVVCLRYFNVYGVNQRYDAYGNVIPIFVHRLLEGQPLTIFGDGEQTRDFVNVGDVASANLLALRSAGTSGAFNLASGTSTTINQLVELLGETLGVRPEAEYRPPRQGDVRRSEADISAARDAFGYDPRVSLLNGLAEYVAWAGAESVDDRQRAR